MGAAAEHRYQALAARQATAHLPTHNELFVRDLNAMPKATNAVKPFGEVVFVQSRGGWFAECPTTGYGFYYRTLREAVRNWRVCVFVQGTQLIGVPA
jgi:hypothetical protein